MSGEQAGDLLDQMMISLVPVEPPPDFRSVPVEEGGGNVCLIKISFASQTVLLLLLTQQYCTIDLATHLAHAQQKRVQKSTAEIMDSNASS